MNKSRMLAEMHPDVARVTWRFGRWHHYVDYSPFKKTKLIKKSDVKNLKSVDNYGLQLIKRNINV